MREDFELLKQWSLKPDKISPHTINSFLRDVHEGLMTERHNKPAHEVHYIEWALTAVDMQLRMFNKQVEKAQKSSGS